VSLVVEDLKSYIDQGQGLDAILEPFYYDKKLTDPINTAQVRLYR
jgi:hypothetical protein